MKHLAYLYKIIGISLSLFLLIPSVAFADNTTVTSQSNGTVTKCVNGVCTTTGGGSSSHVCDNGQCWDSSSGCVDYTSPDGHTHIQINDNCNGGNNTSPSPQALDISPTSEPTVSPTVSPSPIETSEPSITPDPTITQMRNDINKHVQKEIEGIKEHVKDQNAAISDFVKSEMDALQNLLGNMFK